MEMNMVFLTPMQMVRYQSGPILVASSPTIAMDGGNTYYEADKES